MGLDFHSYTLLGCTAPIKLDCGKNLYRNKIVRETSGTGKYMTIWTWRVLIEAAILTVPFSVALVAMARDVDEHAPLETRLLLHPQISSVPAEELYQNVHKHRLEPGSPETFDCAAQIPPNVP